MKYSKRSAFFFGEYVSMAIFAMFRSFLYRLSH